MATDDDPRPLTWTMRSPSVWGASCIGLLVGATLLLLHVSHHGPNAAVPPIFPKSDDPLSPGIAYLLTAVAALMGAGSTACGLVALHKGWSIGPRKLTLLGLVAAAFLAAAPPVGTADIGSYAAYGQMEKSNYDSYQVKPSQLSDPTSKLAEKPWRDTPNVYGPVGTWVFHRAASMGASPRKTVKWLQRGAFLAFALTAFFLLGAAEGKQARRRAALLWSANPLLALHLVSGAHLDVLVALLVVFGVRSAGRPIRRGLAAGLAVATKATAIWPAVALVLAAPAHRAKRRIFVAVFTAAFLYAAASNHVFDQSRHASRYVSAGTPWRWVASALEVVFPSSIARTLVALAALGLTVLMAMALSGGSHELPREGSPARAAWSALIPAVAWMLIAPYQLPWYDAVVWALLAASVAMALDWVVIIHTLVLTVAYLPGRVVDLGDVPHRVQVLMRSGIAPVVVLVCALAAPWALSQRSGARR